MTALPVELVALSALRVYSVRALTLLAVAAALLVLQYSLSNHRVLIGTTWTLVALMLTWRLLVQYHIQTAPVAVASDGVVGGYTDVESGAISGLSEYDVAVNRAAHLFDQGRWAECISILREIVQKDDSHFWAVNNLAYFLAEYTDDTEEALHLAERAFELGRNRIGLERAAAQDTLGWAYFRAGVELVKSEQLLRASLDSCAPDDHPLPFVLYHLIAVLSAAGKDEEARLLYERLVALPVRNAFQNYAKDSATLLVVGRTSEGT